LGKAFQAAAKYLYAGLEETGIDDTNFRILEALLNKGPLAVNTIGPKVHLTPGSISTAVDRLAEGGLVSRAESPDDRRVRDRIAHAKRQRIDRRFFANTQPKSGKSLPMRARALETTLKKIGKRGESLGSGVNPKCLSQRYIAAQCADHRNE
jgi:MarR family transcriptional regulator, 2-MHQ and catechol-resistance regulon repressor